MLADGYYADPQMFQSYPRQKRPHRNALISSGGEGCAYGTAGGGREQAAVVELVERPGLARPGRLRCGTTGKDGSDSSDSSQTMFHERSWKIRIVHQNHYGMFMKQGPGLTSGEDVEALSNMLNRAHNSCRSISAGDSALACAGGLTRCARQAAQQSSTSDPDCFDQVVCPLPPGVVVRGVIGTTRRALWSKLVKHYELSMKIRNGSTANGCSLAWLPAERHEVAVEDACPDLPAPHGNVQKR